MTLPYERTRAVMNVKDFIMRLFYAPSQGGFKRVPKEVRDAARGLLKHYPTDWDMERVAEKAPDIFGKVEREED